MRPARLCFFWALALRAGMALLTEWKPLFPAYYYTDAQELDVFAWNLARDLAAGRRYLLPGSPSQRVHTVILAALYSVLGHHPVAGKLLVAAVGAGVVALFYKLVEPAFGAGAALASALALAVWPSHVFFTSQNFKDAFVMAGVYAALLGAMRALTRARPGAVPAALVFAALFFVGFFRAYLMATLSAVIAAVAAAAAALKRRQGEPSLGLALCLAAALAAPLAYVPLSRALFLGLLAPDNAGRDDPSYSLEVLPSSYDMKTARRVSPFSPQGLSDMRRIRQAADQLWAHDQRQRTINSQLFYGLEFHSWLDVALFLPKGMFYVLFMPLPFIYPMGRNIGRLLASGENLAWLAAALLAAAALARSRRLAGAQALLLAFFAAMAAGSALLEFDLGSAARHKILYLPALFPFAASLAERRKPSGGRLKVFQVLECGGPGGTGNQVAALCNGLDPARFEVSLVFSARGSDPEAYRKSASGARAAFHVPEMTREISPRKDLAALVKLYRLFAREKPDVVHAHSSKAGALARLAARAAGVPKIYYSPHGYAFLQADRSAFSRALYRFAEWAVSWSGEIVAVSPSEAELARPLSWGKPVRVICDAYLGEFSRNGAPHEPGRTVVGACGRLTAARNPDAFAILCQRLTDSRNNLRCAWIGGGELEKSLRQNLENMNLLSKVEITGWLAPEEARRRLASLDVFVHFSRWDGLPNAVLEAMAAGLPVVASDVAGNRDAVVHGETGFLAKNEIELLERALKLVDDPELRRRLGEAGRRRVMEHFSREKALAAFSELYLSA